MKFDYKKEVNVVMGILINQNISFTAYDITLLLREKWLNVDIHHDSVKYIVEDWFFGGNHLYIRHVGDHLNFLPSNPYVYYNPHFTNRNKYDPKALHLFVTSEKKSDLSLLLEAVGNLNKVIDNMPNTPTPKEVDNSQKDGYGLVYLVRM